MAFDAAPTPSLTEIQLERAAFARYCAERANQLIGMRRNVSNCALARFYGRNMGEWPRSGDIDISNGRRDWRVAFFRAFDRLPRQPTGFDALCILQGIP